MKKKHPLTPYLLVLFSFLVVILIGSFFISLPIAQTSGTWGNYIDSFFLCTSATCVTGLCTYESGIGNTLTLFGQVVTLIMIQIGGLGFITVLSFFITLFKSKMQFKNRYFLSQAVNSIKFADVVKFVRKLMLISLICELLGFALLLPVFLQNPTMTTGKAIWNSLFTSVSSFNNAGFDLLGATSFVRDPLLASEELLAIPEHLYTYMCCVCMILIIVGGISFLVIIDVFSFKRPKQWNSFTKIVLSVTAVLLLAGVGVFMLSEGIKSDNRMTFLDAVFQSVTCRTAGYATYSQANISPFGRVFSCILMFIGGSPLSTAGGVKTATIFVIFLAMWCYIRGSKVTAFKRQYTTSTIVKAMSIVFISLVLVMIGYGLISLLEMNAENQLVIQNPEYVAFEVFSAFGTVGLTCGITTTLSIGSKIVLCVLMFLGRLGPMTMLQVFQKNMNIESNDHFKYVEEEFLIG